MVSIWHQSSIQRGPQMGNEFMILFACSLDLKDIKVVCKLGGTVDDSAMIPGAVFDHKASKAAGGPTRVQDAKIGLVQFCISPPKTDIENNVIISDYQQMDRYSLSFPLFSYPDCVRHPQPQFTEQSITATTCNLSSGERALSTSA